MPVRINIQYFVSCFFYLAKCLWVHSYVACTDSSFLSIAELFSIVCLWHIKIQSPVAEYLYTSLILNSTFKLTNHFILIDLREPWEELIAGYYSHFIMTIKMVKVADIYWALSFCGTALNMLCVLTHLIFVTTLRENYYYYLHIFGE